MQRETKAGAESEQLTAINTDPETEDRVEACRSAAKQEFSTRRRAGEAGPGRAKLPYAKQRIAGALIERGRSYALDHAIAIGSSKGPRDRERDYTRSLMVRTSASFWRDLKAEAAQKGITVEELANLYLRLGLDAPRGGNAA